MRDRAAFRAAFLAGAAVVLACSAVLFPIRDWMAALLEWVQNRGAWTAALLGLAWVPAAVLLVPGSILTLGTGFLLGLGWGIVVV
jgi:uncharacterized membrane protein YdjX (TVP38/TMEM64 family)